MIANAANIASVIYTTGKEMDYTRRAPSWSSSIGSASFELRTAFEMFTSMGIEAFAGRAERELLATGERVRKRTVETRQDLTTHEAQVARLAREGLSNVEIGVRLFISQHTVAYHLRKVFSKLDVTSRSQLGGALPEGAGVGSIA